MANKRLPDNVHQLKGTLQKVRHGDPDTKLKLDGKLPPAPAWLNQKAKTEWKRITEAMKKVNVLTAVDMSTLCQYCLLYSELQTEKEEFPAAKHTQLRMMSMELGFTPVSRCKIVVEKSDVDEFSDI